MMQDLKHPIVGEFVIERVRWGNVSLRMEANYWSRAEGTCRQAESFALYSVETSEVSLGCRGVDTTPVIKLGENKRFIEAEKGFAISTPRSERKMRRRSRGLWEECCNCRMWGAK